MATRCSTPSRISGPSSPYAPICSLRAKLRPGFCTSCFCTSAGRFCRQALAKAAAAESACRWGVYNGRVSRIDGEGPGYAEAVPGAPNVAVGGPGLIHMISDTAASLIDTLRPALGAVRPTIAHNLGEEPAAAAVGGGVAVGVPNEDRDGFEWLSEADFNARYNIDDL